MTHRSLDNPDVNKLQVRNFSFLIGVDWKLEGYHQERGGRAYWIISFRKDQSFIWQQTLKIGSTGFDSALPECTFPPEQGRLLPSWPDLCSTNEEILAHNVAPLVQLRARFIYFNFFTIFSHLGAFILKQRHRKRCVFSSSHQTSPEPAESEHDDTVKLEQTGWEKLNRFS